MLLSEIEHPGPLPRDASHMHPDTVVEDPARRRVLHGFAGLVGQRRVMVLEGLTDTLFEGRIPQQAHRHDHQERHDPFRLF